MTLKHLRPLAAALLLAACGGHSEILLEPGPAPDEQTDPMTGKPDDSSQGRRGDGEDPSTTGPGEPAEPKTTLLCEQPGLGRLALLASTATDRDVPASVRLSDKNVESIDFASENIENVRSPLALGNSAKGELEVLISARLKTQGAGPAAAQKIYLARINVAYRVGWVKELATPPAISRAAEELAARAGLRLRQHGVSADGETVIVPSAQGYDLVRAADGKRLATVAARAETNFDPAIGADGVLTFTEFEAAETRFKLRAFKTARVSRDKISVQARPAPAAPDGFSQLGAVVWEDGDLAWLEAKMNERGAAADSARLLVWDAGRGASRAYAVSAVAPATVFYGRPARWDEAGVSRAVLAAETYDRLPSGAKSVRQAELLFLELSNKTAKAVGKAIFPTDTLEMLKTGRAAMNATALIGDADGRGLFVALPVRWGVQAHKLNGDWLEPMTQFACENPGLTRAVR